MNKTASITWTLGDRLAKALRVAGKANNDMALVLGVSRNTVGNYIADRTPIRAGALRLWSEETGVPIEWLKNGDEPHPSVYSATVSRHMHRPAARATPPGRTGTTRPRRRAK